MKFESPLIFGKIQKRYKRFFADINLENGSTVVAHVPNTGSMKDTWEVGGKVALQFHEDPKRKLKYTLVMSYYQDVWIGLHTGLTNRLVEEFLLTQKEKLFSHVQLNREVKVGENSRLDFCLESSNGSKHYIEVKNVTMATMHQHKCVAIFPDAVTERGLKHLEELMQLVQSGHQATIFFCVQRSDAQSFMGADHIDPQYVAGLELAYQQGVNVFCGQWEVSPQGINYLKSIPWIH
jgi:sugar fermentation stimulation protein A